MNYLVDFEGFPLKSFFVIKELVIVSLDSDIKHHFVFNSPNIEIIRPKDRKNIFYCEKYLHGVRWKTRGVPFINLRNFFTKNPNNSRQNFH